MAMENRLFSLGLLKPDCMERGLALEMLVKVHETGLKIVSLQKVRMTAEQVLVFYSTVRKEEFFEEMSLFLQSGFSAVYIVSGEDAIGVLNKLVGATDPANAEPGTIRSFGESIRRNMAHSSDNRYDFLREAGVFWSKEELEKMRAK